MFRYESNAFELEENETEFHEICTKLRQHAFSSPWKMFFKSVDEYSTDVEEFIIEEVEMKEANVLPQLIKDKSTLFETSLISDKEENASVIASIDEKKMYKIKEALMNVQDNNSIENLPDLDICLMIPSSELPAFFKMLDVPHLNEAAVILLINAFLHFKDKISVATAVALVHYVICPKVFEMKKSNSRSLLTSVINFSEVFPKAVIDEVIISFLKEKSTDDLPCEILFQIAKINLPNAYVSYCIKNVLEHAIPEENSFTILQCLIERKINLETTVHELLLQKLLSWSVIYYNNIKFTKLLTSILSTYGSEFTDHQIIQYEEVVKSNKTIIKKAAENLLKKIKQGST